MSPRLLSLGLLLCLLVSGCASSAPAPTDTPAPLPSETSAPAATLPPLPSEVPTQPAIETASAPTMEALPQLNYDLLFISAGSLMRWDHASQRLETLFGPATSGSQAEKDWLAAAKAGPPPPTSSVMRFSLSADGQRLALQLFGPLPENYQVASFDLATRQVTLLYEGVNLGHGLLGLGISPDGNRIAFIPQDTEFTSAAQRGAGLQAHAPGRSSRPLAGGGPRSGKILLAPFGAAPEEVKQIGYCAETLGTPLELFCRGLSWSPSSRWLAWSDAEGIWASIPGGEPRRMAANQPEELTYFRFASWSPGERFLLGEQMMVESSQYLVMDLLNQTSALLPTTFGFDSPAPKAEWMHDNRLFVVRGPQNWENPDAVSAVETWQAVPGETLNLVADQNLPIPASARSYPLPPALLASKDMGFGLFNPEAGEAPYGLYFYEPQSNTAQPVASLPPLDPFSVQVAWAPDGSAAIVADAHLLSLVFTDGRPPVDLRTVLPPQSTSFTWSPAK
jgi:hypothetical protein